MVKMILFVLFYHQLNKNCGCWWYMRKNVVLSGPSLWPVTNTGGVLSETPRNCSVLGLASSSSEQFFHTVCIY